MSEREAYLLGAIALAQFTPRRDDAWRLVAMATGAPNPRLQLLAKALGRLPGDVVQAALAQGVAAGVAEETRVATCALARRLPASHAAAALAALATAVRDPSLAVRKAAVRGLSKHDDGVAVTALSGLATREGLAPEEGAALVRALAKVGATAALAHLQQRFPQLDTATAGVIAGRHAARAATTSLDGIARFSAGTLMAECREGMAAVAVQQYAAIGVPVAALGARHLRLQAPLGLTAALASRSVVRVGLLLGHAKAPPAGDGSVAQLVGLLAGAHARLRAVTTGPIRYRLTWPGATTRTRHEVAAAVGALHPDMTNDPRGAAWQIAYAEAHWVAWPSALPDLRFAWRQGDIPAASHPTVAAALAFLAEPTASDRIWDPFCGSGAELIECGLLAPGASLIGTDLSAVALAVARQNVVAAGLLDRTELRQADALTQWPDATVVVSNPPHGGRVKADAVALHEAMYAHIAARLPAGGRLVWIRHANAKLSSPRLVRTTHHPMTLAGQPMLLERWTTR